LNFKDAIDVPRAGRAFGQSAYSGQSLKTFSKAFSIFIGFAASLLAAEMVVADPLVFAYHGWHVDLTNAKGGEPDQTMIAGVDRQLDIVEHVGLSAETLQFMRGIKIWADPSGRAFGPGHYARATGVDLRVRQLDPNKPIILHELLHAYHDQLLPGGAGNPDVERFFENGKTLWPVDSYMLTNNREFFAVTASVYLFGAIVRPPNSRRELCAKQPGYCGWLANVFDNGRPRT
jgi:hypothetical protein